MAEVEAVMNSRPLTVELLRDGNSLNPISPSNSLTMKSKVVMPPPLVNLEEQIFTVISVGEESNIFQRNFGTDGKKSFL